MEFEAYSVGLCYASVCTCLKPEEATVRLNTEHPTGVRSQWAPSSDATFRSGEANPHPCPDHPGNFHYLFSC